MKHFCFSAIVAAAVAVVFACITAGNLFARIPGIPAPRSVTADSLTPAITPEGSTIQCQGDTLWLDAGSGYATYRWSNGRTTRRIAVTVSATFQVEVTDAEGNRGTSEPLRIVFYDRPQPAVFSSGSTTLCEGDSLQLLAGSGFVSYKWSTGDTTQWIRVGSPGTYTVEVFSAVGCSGTSIPIEVTVAPPPEPVIRADGPTTIFSGETVTLSTTNQYRSYRWSTGERASEIIVDSPGTYTVSVEDSNGCAGTSEPITIRVIDRGGPAPFAVVELPRVSAVPGERITVPLRLSSSGKLDAAAAGQFTARIRFDKSLLLPLGPHGPGVVEGDERVLTVTGERPTGMDEGVLTELEFRAALGAVEFTSLHLDNVVWGSEDSVLTRSINGRFDLLGHCREGGTRLFVEEGGLGLKQNYPNPAAYRTVVEYEVIEEGHTTLSLTDRRGRCVAVPVDEYLTPGSYRLTLDLSDLPAGAYLYILRTPTAMVGRTLIVR